MRDLEELEEKPACSTQGSRKASMPAKPAWAAMQGTSRKKAARVCQSRSFRKVIIVGSRKSLLSLRRTREDGGLSEQEQDLSRGTGQTQA